MLDSDAPITALRTKAVKDWPSYKTLTTFAGETRLNSLGDGPIGGKTVGGDPYFIAKFWAYDATAGLCAPARLYNQIADAVLSVSKQSPWLQDTADIARYYALVNLAMADAAIAAWDSKFYFQFARPVSAIRVQQASELAPGDPKRNESWYPLGAQNTNASVTYNVTPSKLSE